MAADFWAQLYDELPRGVTGKDDAISAARWMEPEELARPEWRYDRKSRPGQVLLGYGRDGSGPFPVGTDDNRHLLTVAGSRAGKGRSLLIPNLLLYPGSALVLDPKGELAAITARRRAELGQKVFIVDPFGVSKAHENPFLKPFLAAYNPLLDIDMKDRRCIDDAAVIADAIIQIPPKGETHWAESAQVLLGGIILLVCATARPENRTLGLVNRVLNMVDKTAEEWGTKNGVPREKALYAMMRAMPLVAFGQVASAGSQMLDLSDREGSSIVSTSRTQCRFLSSPELQEALGQSTFHLADLKRGHTGDDGVTRPVTVYLCLPASMMGSHGRWLRVMINLALIAFERTPMPKPRPAPTLFVLEELCTTLGYSKPLEAAAGLMAGYGIRLWSVVQDLSQLKHHYAESWETFVGNAGTLMFFGNSDTTTLDYISKKLGNTGLTVDMPTGVTPGGLLQGQRTTAEQLRSEPLLSAAEAEQILARENNRILVTPAGKRPFILRRADYIEGENTQGAHNPFAGMYDKHEL